MHRGFLQNHKLSEEYTSDCKGERRMKKIFSGIILILLLTSMLLLGKVLSNQPNFNGSGKTRALPSGRLLNDILLRKNSYK
jgi:hypothetical protein